MQQFSDKSLQIAGEASLADFFSTGSE